ncbi:MAG: anti-sigma regulatory factor [Bacillota bacterium]
METADKVGANVADRLVNPEDTSLCMKFHIRGMDFASGGEASARIRGVCVQLGLPASVTRRVAIVTYEAEMNIVIHAIRGTLQATITPEQVEIEAVDQGPGIPDIDRAMEEGFSTAPPSVREMGFGAGMGLPNIKAHSDALTIESVVGVGTRVHSVILVGQ